MKSKKSLLLLPIGLAFLVCSVALVGSISPVVFGQQQDTTGGNQNMTAQNTMNNTTAQTTGGLDCQMVASTLGGMVIPNPTGTCDVAVPRQGLQVYDAATGTQLNSLLVINPLFEFTQVQGQAAGGGTTAGGNQTMVYGFAEFAFMEGELPSAMRMLADTSWNVIAVHNHVIGESPKMIFAHAVANGDINALVRDARTVLDSLMQGQAGNQTSTTTGGMAGNGTTTGGTGGGATTGGSTNSSPSANSLTGGTTIGEGATAGGGVGTFGGGGGTPPDPGIGTTEGGTGNGTTTGGTGGGATEGGGEASGGMSDTTGGAAGPQVRP
jgi:hypothetical protein